MAPTMEAASGAPAHGSDHPIDFCPGWASLKGVARGVHLVLERRLRPRGEARGGEEGRDPPCPGLTASWQLIFGHRFLTVRGLGGTVR